MQTIRISKLTGGVKRAIFLGVALLIFVGVGLSYGSAHPRMAFVTTRGTGFAVAGRRFAFGGANSYQLPWLSPYKLNSTLGDAQALGFRVIRTFASVQIGDPSRGNVDAVWDPPGQFQKGDTNGVYFQSWDSAAGHMVINDGSNGLPHLDAMIAAAARHHIRLVIALVDNWNYNGGTVQYCAWHHLSSVTLPHSRQAWCPEFYTNPLVRADFKRWTATLLNRRNSVTGVLYKDDPTIMAWELVNEPDADTDTLASWVADMARFIHKIDKKHLITIGDVGFYRSLAQFTRLLDIPHISYGTLHMYPAYDQPSSTPAGCIPILKKYLALGPVSGKPVVLEEFGWSNIHPDQAAVYTQWTNAVRNSGGAGWQFWVFYGHNRDGSFPPDNSEGFNVYRNGSAVTKALSAAAFRMDSTSGIDDGQ